MTICASVKVRDGFVLGTDSMTQIWGRHPSGKRIPVKNYANARKLFSIGSLKIGVMTYGLGNLGARSIYSFLRDFASHCKEDSVEGVSKQLHDFISGAYCEQFEDTSGPGLGFFIAGYSPDKALPEEWEFQLPKDQEARQVRSRETFGASWRGVSTPFTRLYMGFDPRVMEELKRMKVSKKVIEVVTNKYRSPVAYDGMPVQDAINFVVFILQTTIGLATFELGTPSCGGPLQIATILPEEGFEWVQEPELTVKTWLPE